MSSTAVPPRPLVPRSRNARQGVSASAQLRAGRRDAEQVLSPELALVDPALAASARAQLPEPPSWEVALEQRPPVVAAPAPAGRARKAFPRAGTLAAALTCIAAVSLPLSASEKSSVLVERGLGPVRTPPALTHRARTQPAPPAPAPKPAPAAPAAGPTFAWAPEPGAIGYEVQFFKGPTRVLLLRTTKPRLSLPSRWRYAGRRFQLTSGRYRWYVWALHRGRSAKHPVKDGKAIYASAWTLP
jgi:hypothetical protein